MRIRIVAIFLLFIAISAASYAQPVKAVKIDIEGSGLKNLYCVDQGVYRSEQPDAKSFKALEEFGIKEVLNLRRWHSDEGKAKNTSLLLHRLKTNAHSIDEIELTEALRIIARRQGPIVVHCKHGSDRTGAVIAMYRIVFQDVSKEDAIREMTEGGFGFHKIYRNIVRTIREMDVERVKREVKGIE